MKRNLSVSLILMCALALFIGCSKSDSSPGQPDSAGGLTPPAGYPSKNVTVIVPFAAGGGTDLTGRGFLTTAEKYMKTKFLVTNVTGAGGWAGWQQSVADPADGYNMALITVNLFMPTTADITYKDFIPLATLSRYPTVFAVPQTSNINSVAGLIQEAKANPSKLRVAVAGLVNDIDYASAVKFAAQVDIKLNYVPYNGGAESIAAALGGNVDIVVCNTPEVAGRDDMRILAVWAEERLPSLKDIPTMREEGYDVVVTRFRSLAVPKGTPEPIIKYLVEVFRKTAVDPDWQKYADQIKAEPDYLDDVQTAAYMEEMAVKVAEAAKM
ncbi:MAG: tripartite tricarboxylate transporter substrate binding protein [Spirochaetales bacterium]|jgi:tripartite-type tricarboxylate transporter receptor subunit TctC|nr:tripartite tricarboxylate transporter substrate binding protein [Spirochaetales bacterium]